jgi:hypothetical protein
MAPVSDAALFAQEMRTAGALKFFENTEDLLRVALFERALLRYRFLKGQIGGHPGYRALVIMINKRLDFLKGQLRLPEADFAALTPPEARQGRQKKAHVAQAAPSGPPASKQEPAEDGKEGAKVQASESNIPSKANSSPPQGDLGAAPPPHSPASQQQSERIQEQKPPEPPPGPPPSRWQRLKQRLLFWRK